MWRTGAVVEDANVKNFLGFTSDQIFMGFIYLGYPANPLNETKRPSFEDRTVWLE
jgi:hypothetical protein